MRLLTLISAPTLTGPAAPAAFLARRLHEAGADVSVAYDRRRGGDLPLWLKRWGLPVVDGLILSTVARPDQYVADVIRLAAWLRQGRFDALLTAFTNDHLTASFAARLAFKKIPIAAYIGSDPAAWTVRTRAWARRFKGGLLLPHGDWKDWLVHEKNMEEARLFVLPPDVDLERFKPPTKPAREAARLRFGFSPDDRVVGLVGRFKPGRGQIELVRALRRVAPDHPALRLLLVGYGEDLPLCRWLAAEFGLADKIHFPGFLDEDLPAAYHAMDALLLPAVGRDGLGRAALEALASGVPVWAAGQSPLTEAITFAGAGGVVKGSDVAALGAALEEIASAPHFDRLARRACPLAEGLRDPAVAEKFGGFMANLGKTL